MERIFRSSEKIGDIVAEFNLASEIFRRHNIDFCCGGNRLLSEAIKELNLDRDEVLGELNKAYKEAGKAGNHLKDWQNASMSSLIDHIINTHHAYLQKEMPVIGEYTAKILRAHGANHGEMLMKVHRMFGILRMDLEQHLIKEEEILFPLIKEYENSPSQALKEEIGSALLEIEDEHEGAGNILKELEKITDQYTVPADGCRTFMLTYEKMKALEKDLFQHIHLENNILFPKIKNK